MKIKRISKTNIKEFEKSYLSINKPVIVTDAMGNWRAFKVWSFPYFDKNFGNDMVQAYDDLFNLIDVITLKEYIGKYIGQDIPDEGIPYIRWYTRLKTDDFIWADEFFEKIKTNWSLPYFIPNNNYLLPSISYIVQLYVTIIHYN